MSSAKSNPKGLKVVECECGVGGKNAPIHYIPEQDPVQDALERTKMTMYFKLTFPNIGNEIKLVIWASGTPEQFLLHTHSAIHACKLDVNFVDTKKALGTANLDPDLAKMEYTKLHSSRKKGQGENDKGIKPHPDSKAIPPAIAVAKSN